jgi:hypothetical protein
MLCISSAGNEVLRAVQVNEEVRRAVDTIGKLFDLSKMLALKETRKHFTDPAPNHNPAD